MKIRSDFVTNSSSSSFIVVFDNEEDATKSYEKMIRDGLNEEFATVIYKDIVQNKTTYEEAINMLVENVDVYYEYFRRYPNASYSKFWETKEYNQMLEEAKTKVVKQFKEHVSKEKYISIIEYGDEDGSFYSELEHEIMPSMDFVFKRINHH